MTDPAERDSTTLQATRSAAPTTAPEHTPPDAPLRSYINELRARVETLPDDDDALMIPPGASPAPWVATNIELALHAAAETVPRSPSSPDSPFPPSAVPAAELSPRNVRRPQLDGVERFPVELNSAATTPLLRARERGRKSGRFVSPAGLRVSLETEGSIAAAVAHLVAEERALGSAPGTRQAPEAPSDVVAPAAAPHTARDAEPNPPEQPATIDSAPGASVAVVLRGLLLFVTASIASGSAVYFLLRG